MGICWVRSRPLFSWLIVQAWQVNFVDCCFLILFFVLVCALFIACELAGLFVLAGFVDLSLGMIGCMGGSWLAWLAFDFTHDACRENNHPLLLYSGILLLMFPALLRYRIYKHDNIY